MKAPDVRRWLPSPHGSRRGDQALSRTGLLSVPCAGCTSPDGLDVAPGHCAALTRMVASRLSPLFISCSHSGYTAAPPPLRGACRRAAFPPACSSVY